MADFRSELYERYVSSFKGSEAEVADGDMRSFFDWCRFGYLPLVEDLPRDSRILEHFSKDELMRLVPAMRDALEPDGRLILQTPNGQGLFPHQVAYGDLTHHGDLHAGISAEAAAHLRLRSVSLRGDRARAEELEGPGPRLGPGMRSSAC